MTGREPFRLYINFPVLNSHQWIRENPTRGSAICAEPTLLCRSYAEKEYGIALRAELCRCALDPEWKDREVQSIHISAAGGGALALTTTAQIVSIVKDLFPLSERSSTTVEVTPGMALDSNATLEQLSSVGFFLRVNSLGETTRRRIGSPFTAKDIVQAIQKVRAVGVDLIGMDYLFGCPGVSNPEFRGELDVIGMVHPDHVFVSPYLGEAELYQGEVRAEKMYSVLEQVFAFNDYEQERRFDFVCGGRVAVPDFWKWVTADYLGIGIGARSSRLERNSVVGNTSDWKRYIDGALYFGCTHGTQPGLTMKELVQGYVQSRLNSSYGLNTDEFERRFGLSFEAVYPGITSILNTYGFIELVDDHIRLTDRGNYCAQNLLQGFECSDRDVRYAANRMQYSN